MISSSLQGQLSLKICKICLILRQARRTRACRACHGMPCCRDTKVVGTPISSRKKRKRKEKEEEEEEKEKRKKKEKEKQGKKKRKENRSLKRHYGQRYPMPHRLHLMLWWQGNGAAAPEGQMTYDSTQGNFSKLYIGTVKS